MEVGFLNVTVNYKSQQQVSGLSVWHDMTSVAMGPVSWIIVYAMFFIDNNLMIQCKTEVSP